MKELASSELVLFNKVVQFILGASCSSASSQFLFANVDNLVIIKHLRQDAKRSSGTMWEVGATHNFT